MKSPVGRSVCVAFQATDPHVRVWMTTGSWWFSSTRLLPFKRQRCRWVRRNRTVQQRRRSAGQAATQAATALERHGSGGRGAYSAKQHHYIQHFLKNFSCDFDKADSPEVKPAPFAHRTFEGRGSPTVGRPGVKRDSWRNVFFFFFLPLTPSRGSLDISTPSSLVLVYGRRRQTSFDVWITWFHSWRINAARI